MGDSLKKDTDRAARRILVIEDNFDSAEVLQTFLEFQGHEILVKHSAVEGLESARKDSPEIVICDISLPGKLDGYGIAAEIRQDQQMNSTFLIALSGYGRPEDIEKSKSSGFDVHFTKPTDFDALIQTINEYNP